ncbi:MAG TPA: AI-2E family transporter [bacterium]|nr:AI-2E family transporter [bacterium]
MQTQFAITRQNIFVVAFFGLLLGLLSLLFSLLEPFLRSFVWAIILVLVFYPVYSKILKWTGGHASWASFLCTLLVLSFLAVPGFIGVINLGRELPKVYSFLSSAEWNEKSLWVMEKLKSFNIGSWLQNRGIDSAQYEKEIQQQIAGALQSFANLILENMTHIFRNIAAFLLEAAFVSVAVFFFFRDGARLSLKAIEFLPLEKEHTGKVIHTFSMTVTAVVRAIFLTALTEGILSTLGFVAVGVPVPVLLGLAVFILSFIPFLGVTWVWIPAALWLFTQDHDLAAAGLTAWGVLLTTIDHVLRPWLIGSEAKLPLFWLFFTTIGGLKVYGFLGIFLGPIILSLGLAFLAIYREVYLNLKKPARNQKRTG